MSGAWADEPDDPQLALLKPPPGHSPTVPSKPLNLQGAHVSNPNFGGSRDGGGTPSHHHHNNNSKGGGRGGRGGGGTPHKKMDGDEVDRAINNLRQDFKGRKEVTPRHCTSVINLCGKKGRFERALDVRKLMGDQKLAIDTSVVNALIACAVKCKKLAEGFKLFEELKAEATLPGLEPDAHTYNALLVGCVLEDPPQLNRGVELLASMDDAGCPPDVACFETMAHAQARAGHFDAAFKHMAEMLDKERALPVTQFNLSAILDFLAESDGVVSHTATLVKVLADGEVPLSVTNFNSLLDRCIKGGKAALAAELHTRAGKDWGIALNLKSHTQMLDGFVKAGQLAEAAAVFATMKRGAADDEELKPNEKAYGLLINGHLEHGSADDAVKLFHEMLDACVPNPDAITYNVFLGSCCNAKAIDAAMATFKDMEGRGIKPNMITFNTLIKGAARNGKADAALSLLDSMRDMGINPNVVTFGAVVTACVNAGMVDKAFEYLDAMVLKGMRPDAGLYADLVAGLSAQGDVDNAMRGIALMQREGLKAGAEMFEAAMKAVIASNKCKLGLDVLEGMKRSGVTPRVDLFNLLIKACCDRKLLGSASRVLDLMLKWNVRPVLETYNTMLTAYCRDNKVEAAFKILTEANEHPSARVRFDNTVYSALLDGCGRTGNVAKAEEVIKMMTNNQLPLSPHHHVAMVRACGKSGQLERAFEYVNTMKKANSDMVKPSVYAALIEACGVAGTVDVAFGVLDMMKSARIKPDGMTFNAFIDAACHSNDSKRALETLDLMKKEGVAPNMGTALVLIQGLISNNDFANAEKVFNDLDNQNIQANSAIYAAMIRGCFEILKNPKRAMQYWDRMVAEDGLTHDGATYHEIVVGFAGLDDVGNAMQYLQRMDQAGFTARPKVFNALIRAYARNKDFDSVLRVVSMMNAAGVTPYRATYSVLLESYMADPTTFHLARNLYELGCLEDVFAMFHRRLFHLTFDETTTFPEAKMAILKHLDLLRDHLKAENPLRDFDILNVSDFIMPAVMRFLQRDLILKSATSEASTHKIMVDKESMEEWLLETEGAAARGIASDVLLSPREHRKRAALINSPRTPVSRRDTLTEVVQRQIGSSGGPGGDGDEEDFHLSDLEPDESETELSARHKPPGLIDPVSPSLRGKILNKDKRKSVEEGGKKSRSPDGSPTSAGDDGSSAAPASSSGTKKKKKKKVSSPLLTAQRLVPTLVENSLNAPLPQSSKTSPLLQGKRLPPSPLRQGSAKAKAAEKDKAKAKGAGDGSGPPVPLTFGTKKSSAAEGPTKRTATSTTAAAASSASSAAATSKSSNKSSSDSKGKKSSKKQQQQKEKEAPAGVAPWQYAVVAALVLGVAFFFLK